MSSGTRASRDSAAGPLADLALIDDKDIPSQYFREKALGGWGHCGENRYSFVNRPMPGMCGTVC